MLWGKYAHDKGKNIDITKHLVLKASHPSPFSAHHGFFGCKHFSKTNTYLLTHHTTPIRW
jgi:uracil-DNA glycosylase